MTVRLITALDAAAARTGESTSNGWEGPTKPTLSRLSIARRADGSATNRPSFTAPVHRPVVADHVDDHVARREREQVDAAETELDLVRLAVASK